MIRVFHVRDGLGDVAPQAIFWRPLLYFTSAVREDADGLDRFVVATFTVGNWLRFDLRTYAGHPPDTTTLYLDLGMDDPRDVRYAVARAIEEFHLPNYAVGWRRGEEFEYGQLHRSRRDRLREPEARLLVLKLAASLPNRRATTEELIANLPRVFSPSAIDLEQSRTRIRQPKWHQIVRNVISHRDSPRGPFALGLADRTEDGLELTQRGVDYLRDIGYLD
jgi:hypothetical protein